MSNKTNEIICFCGASGVGKDFHSQKLAEKYGYNFIVSHTTRQPRVGESHGNPYWFVNKEIFDNVAMVETRSYDTLVGGIEETWWYGVSKDAVKDEEKYVVVLDMQGLIEFKEYFGDRVTAIYLHVDDNIREQRARDRDVNFDITEWNRRLEDDAKVFSPLEVMKNTIGGVECLDGEIAFEEIERLLNL